MYALFSLLLYILKMMNLHKNPRSNYIWYSGTVQAFCERKLNELLVSAFRKKYTFIFKNGKNSSLENSKNIEKNFFVTRPITILKSNIS